MSLRERLQQELGAAYSLERELSGGGMSRVFVATDTRLGRPVVVKVLSPDIASGISIERFEREIRLAAGLQHPNIVPVLAAGETDGLPYYTMPMVDGRSLRARLAERRLSIAEVTSILRDVSRALDFAHSRGIVHRDIKPDNILLAGEAAVVTDFGIAKAVQASARSGGNETGALTQVGSALGTPAYMAPEQVAGDPTVDGRADLYALGCVAYELLGGAPPFADRTPQRVLAAHLAETPTPIVEVRSDCPPALAALVARLLAKDAAERPQSATEVLRTLDAVATTSGSNAALPVPLPPRGMLLRALGFYAVAFASIYLVARAAALVLGLPEWVVPGVIAIMALGLPALIVTALVQHVARRALLSTPHLTPGGTRAESTVATMALKASPHVSWRRAARGGVLAIAGFAAFVALVMVLRNFGIGPAASLFAAGKLADDDRLIVADFAVPPEDSALSPILSEAVRTALGQSRVVRLMAPAEIADALQRMQRPRESRLGLELAREVAARQNVRGVVSGRAARIAGTGYMLSLELTDVEGASLASFQAAASGPADLLSTIDDLSRRLRGRIGESLRRVNAAPRLERVTTASLPALQKYTEGAYLNDVVGDYDASVRALREAVAIDTTFAMAWRKLSRALLNGLYPQAAVDSAVERAAFHADRLPDREKHLALGAYYEFSSRGQDRAKAIASYHAAFAADSASEIATSQLAELYFDRRDWAQAVRYLRRMRVLMPGDVGTTARLALALAAAGETAAAEALLDSAGRPGSAARDHPFLMIMDATLHYDRGRIAAGDSVVGRMLARQEPMARVMGAGVGAMAAALTGRGAATRPFWTLFGNEMRQRGNLAGELAQAAHFASWDVIHPGRSSHAVARLDSALAAGARPALVPREMPIELVVSTYSRAGRPDRARAELAWWESRADSVLRRNSLSPIRRMRGEIALAEGRPADALAEFRASDLEADGFPTRCEHCAHFGAARAFDAAGQRDSAVAAYQRTIDVPYLSRPPNASDVTEPTSRLRLAQLLDDAGRRREAIGQYLAFAEMWKAADPELLPAVAAARRRAGELSRLEPR
jgi:eukaryotic-like serine/threonine-protein kinase